MKCWAIFSGNLLLPFTCRTTKKQCIQDYLRNHVAYRHYLLDHEKAKKVIITKDE